MGIFYKIITPEGKTNYLFGTLHDSNEEVCQLPNEIKSALDKAKICIFETNLLDENPITETEVIASWIASKSEVNSVVNDSASLSPYIQRALTNHYQFLKKNNPHAEESLLDAEMEQIAKYIFFTPPIKFALEVLYPDKKQQVDIEAYSNCLDTQLVRHVSKDKQKKIYYLESIQDQLEALYGLHFTFVQQVEIYNYMAAQIENGLIVPEFSEFRKAYLEENFKKIKDNAEPFHSENPPELVQQYYNKMFADRDLHMYDRMKTHLNEGDAFIAVGVSHLEGIISQLQKEGYQIESVSLGKRTHHINQASLGGIQNEIENEDSSSRASLAPDTNSSLNQNKIKTTIVEHILSEKEYFCKITLESRTATLEQALTKIKDQTMKLEKRTKTPKFFENAFNADEKYKVLKTLGDNLRMIKEDYEQKLQFELDPELNLFEYFQTTENDIQKAFKMAKESSKEIKSHNNIFMKMLDALLQFITFGFAHISTKTESLIKETGSSINNQF